MNSRPHSAAQQPHHPHVRIGFSGEAQVRLVSDLQPG